MIIGNNNPSNRNGFGNHNSFRNHNQTNNQSMPNSFENRWNKVQEYNQNRPERKNVFVKDIKEQKYSSSTDTAGMQDRTLAMLHERLQQGTITLEEFNRKCAQLGQQRQNMSKNNKLF